MGGPPEHSEGGGATPQLELAGIIINAKPQSCDQHNKIPSLEILISQKNQYHSPSMYIQYLCITREMSDPYIATFLSLMTPSYFQILILYGILFEIYLKLPEYCHVISTKSKIYPGVIRVK
jgi:hypothetical protein